MKKIKLLLLSLISVSFFGCYDESGEYAREIILETDVVQGFKQCLNISLDTANAHLSVPGGYSEYNGGTYKIVLPSGTKAIQDSLAADYQYLIDSLVNKLNLVAENSGSSVKTAFNSIVSTTTFVSTEALLNGGDNAITDYFRSMNTNALISELGNYMQSNITSYQVPYYWNQVQYAYSTFDTIPVNINITQSLLQQMVTNLLVEMEIEEKMIRTDSTHRVTDLLKRVFR